MKIKDVSLNNSPIGGRFTLALSKLGTKRRGEMRTMFSGKDVLRRALGLVRLGPLPGENCNSFCPWCAIAIAKGQLDEENGIRECLFTIILNFTNTLESDGPLEEAREALSGFTHEYGRKMNQDRAIAIFNEILEE